MNTQPLFTVLDLWLNTPDPDTSHHSPGNTDKILIRKHKPPHHNITTAVKWPREENRERWRVAGKAQKLEPGVPV